MKVAAMRIPQKEKNIESFDNLGVLENTTDDVFITSEEQVNEKEEHMNSVEEVEAPVEKGDNLIRPVRRLTEEEKVQMLGEQSNPVGEAEEPAEHDDNLTRPVRRLTEEEKAEMASEQTILMVKQAETSKMPIGRELQNEGSRMQKTNHCVFTRPSNMEFPIITECNGDTITFSEREDTYANESGEETKLFNGTADIVSVKELMEETYNRDGSIKSVEKRFMYDVCLRLNGQIMHTTVDTKELYKGSFIMEVSGGKSMVFRGKAKKYYEILINRKLNAGNYPTLVMYAKGGLKKFPDGGYRYLMPNGVIGSPELPIKVNTADWFGVPNQSFDDAFMARYFFQMREIISGSNGIVLMQYYGLIGVLRTLLKEYGIEPDFSLMVRGPSNVGKSTIAVFLYKIMNRHILRNADADFTATVKALDEMKAVNPDTVFLFDDITPKNKKKAGEKLEFLLRQYGNDHANAVSQIYAKQHGVKAFSPVLNQLAVTAEVMPDLSASARSRMIDVEIKSGESNFQAITREQQHAWMLAQFYFRFIRFITENQWSLLPTCRDKFMRIRNLDMLQCKMKRYNSTFAVFMIIGDILKSYMVASGEFSAEEVDTIIANDLEAIKAVILDNDKECSLLSEIENVTDAIDEMVAEAIMTEARKERMETGGKIVIFHNGFFVIRAKDMLKMVNSYLHQEGVSVSLTSSKLGKLLHARELIRIATEGGKLRRTHKFVHNGVNYGRCYFVYGNKLNAIVTSTE